MFDLLEWLVPKAEAFPRGLPTTRSRPASLEPRWTFPSISTTRRAVAASRAGMLWLKRMRRLNKLRLYLRLAHHWRWLSDGQYEHVSRMVAEIGRLLGGWIRQAGRDQPG